MVAQLIMKLINQKEDTREFKLFQNEVSQLPVSILGAYLPTYLPT